MTPCGRAARSGSSATVQGSSRHRARLPGGESDALKRPGRVAAPRRWRRVLAQPLRRHPSVTAPRLRLDATTDHESVPRSCSVLQLDHVKIEAWQRLLFLECGDGWIVEEAWRRARRGYACGVDTSAALVARATQVRGIPGALEFKTWDGLRLPFPSAFFHSVMSTLTLGRCPDPGEVLGEMYRVLQPGGDLYLLECDQAALRPVGPTSLVAMLDEAGFDDMRELSRCDVALEGRGGVGGGGHLEAVILRARAVPVRTHPRPTAGGCGRT
jgi:SAM-dependent methyltransferase